jgi:hypothetical protein
MGGEERAGAYRQTRQARKIECTLKCELRRSTCLPADPADSRHGGTARSGRRSRAAAEFCGTDSLDNLTVRVKGVPVQLYRYNRVYRTGRYSCRYRTIYLYLYRYEYEYEHRTTVPYRYGTGTAY